MARARPGRQSTNAGMALPHDTPSPPLMRRRYSRAGGAQPAGARMDARRAAILWLALAALRPADGGSAAVPLCPGDDPLLTLPPLCALEGRWLQEDLCQNSIST